MSEKKPTRWVTICFDTKYDFVKPSYTIRYDSFDIEIKRGTETEGHELYVEVPIGKEREGYEVCRRFMSELSWLYKTNIEELTNGTSGHKCSFNVANMRFSRIANGINLGNYRQVAFAHEQKLALGFYKDGISSNSNFCKFLSFYKVINIKFHSGMDQKNWINANISRISHHRDRLEKMKNEGVSDFGDYIYKSCRCAIAHASIQSGDPIADVDNYDDNYRLNLSLPVIKELSELFIKLELGVSVSY